MAGKMQLTEYTSDDGVTYNVEIDKSNADAVSANPTALPARRNLPHGYEPRHVWAVDDHDVTGGRTPTFARRKVIIPTTGSLFWIGTTTVVTLPDFSVTPSAAASWTIVAFVGEKRFNR